MRAPSDEEKAPTAKDAKHEEQIRVRARDGEEVTLSRDVARLMGTLKDLMDLATSEDGIYPLPTIMASTLQLVCKLIDPDYTWPSSDERLLFQLIQLIEDVLYLDAPIALKHIQRVIASRLNGKRAPELCALIGAGGDFGSAEKHAPPNAEPAFVPEDVEAPQQPATFSGASLQPADAILIASDLKFMAVLTFLRLDSNNIGDEGAKAIAEALKVNAVLTVLELHGNNISDEGAKAIAEALKDNAVLTILDLRGNNIGDGGAKAIAEALKVNAVLASLDVGHNSFDEQVALGIVRAARQHDKITDLGLSSCQIGPIGAKEIADYIQFTAVLTVLYLGENRISDGGAKAIAEALKVNAVLTKLDLEYNNMGDAGKQAVRDAVKGRSRFKLHL